jgi:hypothetical protein
MLSIRPVHRDDLQSSRIEAIEELHFEALLGLGHI